MHGMRKYLPEVALAALLSGRASIQNPTDAVLGTDVQVPVGISTDGRRYIAPEYVCYDGIS